MIDKNKTTITTTLITLLLFVQVLLSIIIIIRLNGIDQAITLTTSPSPQEAIYVENVSVDDDPMLGIEDAPVTIVAFSDYECPFCADANDAIETLLAEYEGQIQYVYRDFPLEHLHPHAFQAAEAANCAGQQGLYWDMHALLLDNQTNLDTESLKSYARELNLDMEEFDNCLTNGRSSDEVRHDIEEALSYGVRRTPSFFINGHLVTGSSLDILQYAVELALKEQERQFE